MLGQIIHTELLYGCSYLQLQIGVAILNTLSSEKWVLGKAVEMSHHMRSELDVDICCTPRLQVFMADFFLLFLQAKTLEILPYFLGGKKGTICKKESFHL